MFRSTVASSLQWWVTGIATWMLEVVAGPDAGRAIALAPGRHRLGRAGHDVVIDDRALEIHHAHIDVGEQVGWTQLTGRTPDRVYDDRNNGDRIDGGVELGHGSLIEIGSTLLRLSRSAAQPSRIDAGWRAPRAMPMQWPVMLGVGTAEAHRSAAIDRALHDGKFFERSVGSSRCPRALVHVDLARQVCLGVTGPHRAAVVRSMIGSLARCPTSRPLVVSRFGRRLVRVVDGGPGLVVLCDSSELEHRPSVGVTPATFVALAEHDDDLPEWCTARVTVGSTWHGTFDADTRTGFARRVRLHLAGCTPTTAFSNLAITSCARHNS